MSIESGEPPPDPQMSENGDGSVRDLLRAGNVDSGSAPENRSNAVIAELEKQLAQSEDRRLEERFQYVVGFVVLFDTIVFSAMDTWSAPIVIGIMELVGLVSLAKTCRVDVIMPILDRIAGAFPNGNRSKPTDSQ